MKYSIYILIAYLFSCTNPKKDVKYYENGNIKEEAVIENGKNKLINYFEDGTIKSIRKFGDKGEEGLSVFYIDSILISSNNSNSNDKDNEKSHKIEKTVSYYDGLKEGWTTEFNSKGDTIRRIFYDSGYPRIMADYNYNVTILKGNSKFKMSLIINYKYISNFDTTLYADALYNSINNHWKTASSIYTIHSNVKNDTFLLNDRITLSIYNLNPEFNSNKIYFGTLNYEIAEPEINDYDNCDSIINENSRFIIDYGYKVEKIGLNKIRGYIISYNKRNFKGDINIQPIIYKKFIDML